jgi:hypothetical protein
MKRTCRVLMGVVAIAMVCAGCGGRPPRRLHEKAGGFSYDPPAEWTVISFPGLAYRVAHGPPEHEFAANINVVDEAFAGSLADYVEENLQSMEKMFGGMRVLRREEFKTKDGESAVRILTENEQQGRLLRQTFVFIGEGARKYVFACTALAEGGDQLDAAFLESAQSFRLH